MMMEYIQAHPLTVRYAAQFPLMRDRAAWEAVDSADREDLLALAEAWRERPYPQLTAGMYASFIRTGSRRDCETPYFARRVKLCAAALHMCLTGTEEMLGDVEDGLWLLCEETTWAISAHVHLTAEHPFPDPQRTVVDLFAAQTAMILSFVGQLLGDALHPDLTARVRSEVERRVLRPFMEYDGEWWMGFGRADLNNWTPWIISNVLMTSNVWQYGGAALVERACGMLDRWLACVPEDGGCDEGAGYWNMAGGAFLDCLMLLEQTCGMHLWDVPKVQRMMAYPELVYLGNGWCANFADCDARPSLSGERLQYAGGKTGNAALIRMGRELRRLPSGSLSDTPHLSRVLMRLFSRPVQDETDPDADIADLLRQHFRLPREEMAKELAAHGIPVKDVWLPDLQVRLLDQWDLRFGMAQGRRVMQPQHVTAAMKGGHNAESHNHNDVGSFLLAVNGQMQVVDAGNMIYTARTFSDSRYELWNCRGAYHNVPIIGGYEQAAGAEHAARDVQRTADGMTLDMAAAYPAEAGVRTCRRDMALGQSILSVQDEIVLDAPAAVTWVLMLRDEPVIEAEEKCCHGRESGFFVEWRDTEALTAAAEPIEITDGRMAKSYPGKLWRLTLTAAPSDHHSIHITMQA